MLLSDCVAGAYDLSAILPVHFSRPDASLPMPNEPEPTSDEAASMVNASDEASMVIFGPSLVVASTTGERAEAFPQRSTAFSAR